MLLKYSFILPDQIRPKIIDIELSFIIYSFILFRKISDFLAYRRSQAYFFIFLLVLNNFS